MGNKKEDHCKGCQHTKNKNSKYCVECQAARDRSSEDSEAALLVEREKIAEEDHALVRQQIARKKLLAPYTDGLPYSRDRVIGEAKRHLYQSFESAIECGKYLIWLHEEEGQTFALLYQQHFSHVSFRTAKNFMRLARVSVEHPKLQGFIEKNRSRAIALLEILDEEDLTEFDRTGSIAGMEMDEVEKLPVRQLKDELRAAKKKEDRGKIQLREAEDKIKDLEGKIKDLENPKLWNSKEEELLAVITDLGNRFEQIMLLIKTRVPYDKEGACPEKIKAKLYYLIFYMQRELHKQRIELAQYCDDALDAIEYEPDETEEPPALLRNVPHLEPVMKAIQKRKGSGK